MAAETCDSRAGARKVSNHRLQQSVKTDAEQAQHGAWLWTTTAYVLTELCWRTVRVVQALESWSCSGMHCSLPQMQDLLGIQR